MNDLADVEQRAGYVALVGQPNAGKSSLLNRLVEQKLSAVSSVAQTTRERVVGIDTRDNVQMVFVDTPGLLVPRHLLHRTMLQSALTAIADADAAVLVADATEEPPELDPSVESVLRARSAALVLAANKSDIARPEQIARTAQWAAGFGSASLISVSAKTGAGVAELRAALGTHMPSSPFLFPADEVATQSVRFFVTELIRESALSLYSQEVPHGVAVAIEEFRESSEPVYIRATVYVERESQKRIVVGKGGEAIKRLGAQSRKKIERLLGARVFLDLWIKVLPNWRRDPEMLRRLGFEVPPETV